MRKRVWVSTVSHLERFRSVIASATPDQRSRVRYTVPDGMPYNQPMAWLQPSIRAPLVLLSAGELTVGADGLAYRASAGLGRLLLGAIGSRWENLDDQLSFSLPWSALLSVEVHEFCSAVAAAWDITFARLRTSDYGLRGDFLLCPALTIDTLLAHHRRRDAQRLFAEYLGVAVDRHGWLAQSRAAGA